MSSDLSNVTQLRAEFAQPDEAPNPDDCPPPDRLWSAAQGELPPAEVRAVIEHLATCAPCAEEWRLAVALAGPQAQPQDEEETERPASNRRAILGLVAASLVAATIGGPLLFHPGDGMRGAKAEITSPDDDKTQPRDRFLVHWNPPAGSSSCDLEVFSDASETVAEKAGIVQHEYQVPPSALRSFPAGSTVNWMVTCNLPEGRRQPSTAFKTRLR